MTEAERAVRDGELVAQRRKLRRVVHRGPMEAGPEFERFWTGSTYEEKVAAQLDLVEKLAVLR